MLYAIRDGLKITATPNTRAFCPSCNEETIAKCGNINIWHWAHKNNYICDDWQESETAWHLYWKSLFPIDWVEIVIENEYCQTHRADVLLPDGRVIEFQHSYISPEEIEDREDFYENMIWVFDIREAAEYRPAGSTSTPFGTYHFVGARFETRKNANNNYWTFRWKHPKKHIAYTTADCYLDMGNNLFWLKKMYPSPPCGGWGYKISYDSFLKKYCTENMIKPTERVK